MHSFTLNHSFPSIPETLFQKGLFWKKRNDKNRSIKQEIEPCIYNLLNWFTFFCCILLRFTTHHQKSLSRVTIFIPFSAIYYLEYHFLMIRMYSYIHIYIYKLLPTCLLTSLYQGIMPITWNQWILPCFVCILHISEIESIIHAHEYHSLFAWYGWKKVNILSSLYEKIQQMWMINDIFISVEAYSITRSF